jgi:hypothetical protein
MAGETTDATAVSDVWGESALSAVQAVEARRAKAMVRLEILILVSRRWLPHP